MPATDAKPAPATIGADPLVIRRLEFLGGMASPDGWRPSTDLPEIAVAGRSNVGKSSLLNRLFRRRAFARVSNTPGRTRELNFFRVNDEFVLVDLPGYGYARVAKSRRDEWRPLIGAYLRQSPTLRGIVELLDVRHDPTEEDQQMFDLLAELGLPTLVVATKTDKLKPAQLRTRLQALAKHLRLDEDQLVPFSAVSDAGRNELAEAVVALLRQPAWRATDAD